jgi:hypothetical protein
MQKKKFLKQLCSDAANRFVEDMANSLDLESQSEDGWMHMLYVYTKDE